MAVSLQDHVQQRHGNDLAAVFGGIAAAAVQIESRIRTAPLSGMFGAVGNTNVQGEQQQKLDVFANDAVVDAMRALPQVSGLVSEEDDEPIVFEQHSDPKFVVITDPLDGSSNIDVDVNVGTIVSIQAIDNGEETATAALKQGSRQAAALYVNYGPSTMLVYTAGQGVHSFTLSDGEFLLNAENVSMPESGPYYSVNEGNITDFPEIFRDYVGKLRDGSLLQKRLSSRYVGSFIADFHRTLLKGGVFLYPPTAKTPQGKLRLLYEANPLAFIAEQAGGAAVAGSVESEGREARRILDLIPVKLHERTTLVIGSKAEVAAFCNLIAAAGSKE